MIISVGKVTFCTSTQSLKKCFFCMSGSSIFLLLFAEKNATLFNYESVKIILL